MNKRLLSLAVILLLLINACRKEPLQQAAFTLDQKEIKPIVPGVTTIPALAINK